MTVMLLLYRLRHKPETKKCLTNNLLMRTMGCIGYIMSRDIAEEEEDVVWTPSMKGKGKSRQCSYKEKRNGLFDGFVYVQTRGLGIIVVDGTKRLGGGEGVVLGFHPEE